MNWCAVGESSGFLPVSSLILARLSGRFSSGMAGNATGRRTPMTSISTALSLSSRYALAPRSMRDHSMSPAASSLTSCAASASHAPPIRKLPSMARRVQTEPSRIIIPGSPLA